MTYGPSAGRHHHFHTGPCRMSARNQTTKKLVRVPKRLVVRARFLLVVGAAEDDDHRDHQDLTVKPGAGVPGPAPPAPAPPVPTPCRWATRGKSRRRGRRCSTGGGVVEVVGGGVAEDTDEDEVLGARFVEDDVLVERQDVRDERQRRTLDAGHVVEPTDARPPHRQDHHGAVEVEQLAEGLGERVRATGARLEKQLVRRRHAGALGRVHRRAERHARAERTPRRAAAAPWASRRGGRRPPPTG